MSEKIIYVKNTQEFDDLLSKEKLLLVDFWATWCGPCRMIAPVIDQVAEQFDGKVTVAKVDTDENQELAIRYGIQTIPTVMIFKDGKNVAKEIGVKPLKSFVNLIEKHTA